MKNFKGSHVSIHISERFSIRLGAIFIFGITLFEDVTPQCQFGVWRLNSVNHQDIQLEFWKCKYEIQCKSNKVFHSVLSNVVV